jgi:hypothetical protein
MNLLLDWHVSNYSNSYDFFFVVGWMVVMPMILPQVMQLLPQACCLHVLNQVGIR